MRILICLVGLALSPVFLQGQLTGYVRDTEGNALPYAAVYVKNSTHGTSCNADGFFSLALDTGSYDIVFHYLGFQSLEQRVHYRGVKTTLTVMLSPANYSLKEIIIGSDSEDPAYGIIRKAMAKRKHYLESKSNYVCDAYTKGFIRILDAPLKILGKEIGNLAGNLDSNRQGMVYLSETVSRLTFRKPDLLHEDMLSSVVSGNDNGFSFNRAGSADFNLYENVSGIGKNVVSPIADYAMDYYKYRLIGMESSLDGITDLYKIQLQPKRINLPAWNGFIYIRSGDYSIHSADFFVTGKQIQQELFDTLFLTQLYIPVREGNEYALQNQVFGFSANFIGFRMAGKFVVVFSNYDFSQETGNVNNRVMVEIREGANTRTEAYWDSIRPIPLSRDEAADYHQKDSIRLVRESRTYIDSMDRVSNYFRSKNLLLGYTYTRSAKNDAFTFYAPLELFHFNPIQGWAVGADLRYTRTKGRGREFNRFLVKTRVDYGFSEKQLRPTLQFQFRFDEISKSLLELELGKDLVEFNGQKSSKLFYESSNLFYKNNYIKYFDKEFVALTFGRNLHYDLRWRSELEFAIRRNAYIHSEFSFWNSSRPYQENQYADLLPDSLYIFNREVLRWTQALRWQPGTKVWKTPDELFSLGSSWPVFKLDYTAGVYLKKRQWFQRFSWSIEKYFDLEEWGEPRLLVEGDHLISKEKPDAPDWIFHNGNGLPFYVNTEGLGKFLTLYPFGFAGEQQSLAWHLEWDLKGRLLGRIPGVNRLGFNEIFRVSQLYVKEFRPYMEWSAGLGNVGYRFFRFLRVEWVNQFHSGGFRNAYLRVGLMSNILQGQ